jgi:hypothetical protein
MMYHQKLVASIKANGKILREFKDTVYVPFGTEYSVLLKNLSTVRCIVNMSLDGTDVVPGGLVIAAGQVVDLERWIKNGNMSEGNKFKFIERTAQIEAHKGIGLEDGIINITYQFEHPPVQFVPQWQTGLRQDGLFGKMMSSTSVRDYGEAQYTKGISGSMGSLRSMNISASGASASVTNASLNNVTAQAQNVSYNDAGITVAGSKSEQKFAQAAWFPVLPEKHSIVLKLLGETPDNKPIVEAVTVKKKPVCSSCGKHNKATASFCSACGTALTIYS